MNDRVEWIAACGEKANGAEEGSPRRGRSERVPLEDLPVHGFPQRSSEGRIGESQKPHAVSAENAETRVGHPLVGHPPVGHAQTGVGHLPLPEWGERLELEPEEKRERRIYRGRTVAMLRRYMRYSIETGRLPSILGREFFRSKVTSYIVVTFEKNDVRRNVIERLVNAGTAMVISAAIAMHRLWWK